MSASRLLQASHPKCHDVSTLSRVQQNAPYTGGVNDFVLAILAEPQFRFYGLDGPRKDAINAFQKQIDIHFEEINKLDSSQNSRVPVSDLPIELLLDVFLWFAEPGLQNGDLGFAEGTFMFRQVCRHWNEVAVGFPQLWARWASRAVNSWPLLEACSKDAPIFLTWQPYHSPTSG